MDANLREELNISSAGLKTVPSTKGARRFVQFLANRGRVGIMDELFQQAICKSKLHSRCSSSSFTLGRSATVWPNFERLITVSTKKTINIHTYEA
jgi:hypothetical protein